jgi:hypothetical protein
MAFAGKLVAAARLARKRNIPRGGHRKFFPIVRPALPLSDVLAMIASSWMTMRGAHRALCGEKSKRRKHDEDIVG